MASTRFAPDLASLKGRITRMLKMEILQRASQLAMAEKKELSADNFSGYEATARQKLRSRHAADHVRFKKDLEASGSVDMTFRKAICNLYDPHTEYFSETEMEAFNKHLRDTEKGFGFEVEFDPSGSPIIARLQPGGPAWKTNLLHERDILISLKPDGGASIDFADLDDLEIYQELNDPAVSTAELLVKKTDGRLISVKLGKEKIENIENMISSFVLTKDTKVGYLSLPSFYTNPEMKEGRGCAEDVAREVIKLKKDGIKGLILDLRYNGGGSLKEALELAGLFIDMGPVGIFELKGNPPATLRDPNRGFVYDGPLLVLVNGLSASASEFIAAALQDYNRALIVGAKTYGKATGQEVTSLSSVTDKPGFVKITTSRLYRVSGNSLQQSGVTPDIGLPDVTAFAGHRESAYSNSLPAKNISKRVYFTPLPPIPRAELAAASKQRSSDSEALASLTSLGKLLGKPMPVNLDAYLERMKEINALIQSAQKTVPEYDVASSGTDQKLHQVDAFHQQISERAMEEIKRSAYIREAFFILQRWVLIK